MAIGQAIKKYGKDKFVIKELCQCRSQTDLDDAEIMWIVRLNSLVPNGYNISTGGQGPGRMAESTKRKISRSLKGRVLSQDHIRKLSESHKGNRLSNETKRKLSLYNKGKVPPKHVAEAASKANAKNYIMMSPSGEIVNIYNMRKFCADRGLSPSKMSCVVNGKRNHHKGWRRTND